MNPERGAATSGESRAPDDIQLLRTLRGHSDVVLRIAWSHDGASLATSSVDHTIRVYDWASGSRLATLQGHHHGVNEVSWSPDATWLASASYDRTIRIWDVANGRTTQTLSGHTGDVSSLALNRDGTLLASGSEDTTVRLWSAPDGRELAVLDGHRRSVYRVAFSPDGRWLAAPETAASGSGTPGPGGFTCGSSSAGVVRALHRLVGARAGRCSVQRPGTAR